MSTCIKKVGVQSSELRENNCRQETLSIVASRWTNSETSFMKFSHIISHVYFPQLLFVTFIYSRWNIIFKMLNAYQTQIYDQNTSLVVWTYGVYHAWFIGSRETTNINWSPLSNIAHHLFYAACAPLTVLLSIWQSFHNVMRKRDFLYAAKFESYGYCGETHVVVGPPGVKTGTRH